MEKSLSTAILSGNAQSIAHAYNRSGAFYAEMGDDIARAERDFRNAYAIAVKNELYDELSNALCGITPL